MVQAHSGAFYCVLATNFQKSAHDDRPRSRRLTADDEHDIWELVSDLLTSEGYVSSVAIDGEVMLRLLAESRPDLILLDVMLPGTDGVELCRQLRLGAILRPLYRLERSRNPSTGGIDLGLTITQNIMRAHRGKIRLSNRPEGGLKVELLFTVSRL